MNLNEQATLKLVINGKEARNELDKLSDQIEVLKTKQAEFGRGDKAYKDLAKEIKDLNATYKTTEERLDINIMKTAQLEKYQRDLARTIKNDLTPGSEEYQNSLGRLTEVNTRLATLRTEQRAVNVEGKSMWAEYGGYIKGALLAGGVIGAILQVFEWVKNFTVGAIQEAKAFQTAAQELAGETGITGKALDDLKRKANDTGVQFGQTGTEMLKAYNAVASGKSDLIGVKGAIEGVTEASLKLAVNGGMKLEDAAKVMTESLNQYGEGAESAAKFVDILSTGTQVGAGKIQEIAQSLKYVGPIAKAAGLDFGVTNAALQILHQNGIKGEQAGTALRGMLSQLLKGSNETNPAIVGFSTAIDNLAKKHLSAKDAVELFGRESASAGISIIDNAGKLKEWTAAIEKGGGAASMYAEKTDTAAYKEKVLSAEFAKTQQQIGEGLMPVYNGLLLILNGGMKIVNSFIDNFAPMSVVFSVVWRSVKNLWNSMVDLFYTLFPDASKYSFSMANAVKILATTIMLLMTPLIIIRGLIVAMIDAMAVATNGFKMMAAAAKGDFAGAVKFSDDLGKSWDKLKNRATDNFSSIKNSFSAIWVDEKKNLDKSLKNNDDYNADVKKTNENRTEDEKAELGKRAKNRKEAAEEEKRLQKETDDLLDKLFLEHLELVKKDDAEALKERQESSKKMQDIIEQGEKAILKLKEELGGKGIFTQKVFGEKVKAINKEITDEQEKQNNELEQKQIARKQRRLQLEEQMKRELLNITGAFLDGMGRQLQRQMDASTDYVEKAMLQQKINSLTIAEEALSALGQLAQGDVVGAIVTGVKVVFSALDNWVSKTARLTEANLAKLKEELRAAGEDFVKSVENFGTGAQFDKIKQYYAQFLQSFDVSTLRLDLGEYDSYERRLEQEFRIAEKINENYNQAVARENEYSQNRLRNIDEAYQKDIAGINTKYSLLAQKANMQYNADSLAIQQSVNADLMAFINNEDLKVRLKGAYEDQKAKIQEKFALAYKPITADMSQAEIDGINEAIKARDAAFAKLEEWQTGQIQFVIANGKLEVDTFTEVQKVIAKGKDDQYQLSLKFQAAEIQRNMDKNQEIIKAEQKKNSEIELEAKRHNDELVILGLEKDRLLAESFLVLKDIITNGYDDMMNAAMDALNAGKITGEQYDAIASRLFNIKNLIGEIDWSKLTFPNFDLNNLPKAIAPSGPEFANGGWIAQGSRHSEGGIHLIDDQRGYLGNMEGGEYIGIFSREVTAKYGDLLHKIQNSSLSTTGKPIYAEKGYFGDATGVSFSFAQKSGGGVDMGLLAAEVKFLNLQTAKTNELLDAIVKSNANIADKPVLSTRKIQEELQREYDVQLRGSFS